MDLVRATARSLVRLHGDDANAYWRATARELYRDLLARGHDDLRARAEIGRFSDSVQSAMRKGAPQELSSITG